LVTETSQQTLLLIPQSWSVTSTLPQM